MMVMMAPRALGPPGQLAFTNRAVLIAVERVEEPVDLGHVGAGPEGVLEFGLVDLSVAVGVELAEQVVRARRHAIAGALPSALRLHRDQVVHGIRADAGSGGRHGLGAGLVGGLGASGSAAGALVCAGIE